MQELQQSPELSQFLASMKNYIVGEPKIVSGEKVWNLKQTILADGPVALNELQNRAAKLGITFSRLPTPKFSLKEFTPQSDNTLLYLHESQIEDGGPQPRIEINPSDPETQALFELIKANGQRVPINVYPSPTALGKYRIAEGHRRRMIIFNMLRFDGIWAISKQRTELEAYEDAFDLNNARKNLSATDQGIFFQTLMAKFPTVYPTQQSIADRRKLDKSYVSRIMSSLELVNEQKSNLAPDILTQVNRLPEHTIRPVAKVADENKSAALIAIVENKLTSPQAERLVEAVNAESEPTAEFVADEAKRIKEQKAEVRAQEYMKEADKITAKTERLREKVVAVGVEYPEDLMKAVFGVLGLKGKVDPGKAKALASTAVAVFCQKCVEKQIFAVDSEDQTHLYELADLVREASTWQ